MAPDPNPNQKENFPVEDSFILANNIPIAGYSSDEENEHIENNEYELLPQDAEILDEEQIDFSSLQGILHSLNTYGPQNIDIEEESIQLEEFKETEGHAISSENNLAANNSILEHGLSQCGNEVHFQRSSQIIIDKEKEEEIKHVMSKIKLPASAIPKWANQLPDQDWNFYIQKVLHGNTNADDDAVI